MKININDIQDGEPKHSQLDKALIERIKAFKTKLTEVDNIPLDKTIDNFRYDRNPENEVLIWEEIANLYQKITQSSNPSIEYKKELYSVLLMASCDSIDNTFLQKLSFVSRTDAEHINSIFEQKKPITVRKGDDYGSKDV